MDNKIKKIIDDHEAWVGDKTTGKRADLSKADLSGLGLKIR